MKKNGLTLIELIITMVLAGILITAMICQFTALVRFNKMVEFVSGQTRETPLAVREARVVLKSLTHVLRFAKAMITGTNTLTATIEDGHISLGPPPGTDHIVVYQLQGNALHFIDQVAGTDVIISENVSQLSASWNYGKKETTLILTFTDANNNDDLTINTKIKALTD